MYENLVSFHILTQYTLILVINVNICKMNCRDAVINF